MKKKLTNKQKLKNQKKYKEIRKGYNEVKNKNKLVTYKQFKNRVQAQMEANPSLNLKGAIKKVQNTETFTSAAERSRINFIKALKKDFAEAYKKIRNLNREENGRFKKKAELELEWTEHDKRWGYSFIGIHGVKYFIDVKNSPEEVLVYEIQE